jgi:Sodium:sulfate symporter transmembrane region
VKRLVASLLLLLGIVFFLPLPESGPVMDGLDPSQVRLGIGLFVCIAFLWMTEALPLSITALLVPVLAAVMGLGEIKSSLASFGNPLIFVFFGTGLGSLAGESTQFFGERKIPPCRDVALYRHRLCLDVDEQHRDHRDDVAFGAGNIESV